MNWMFIVKTPYAPQSLGHWLQISSSCFAEYSSLASVRAARGGHDMVTPDPVNLSKAPLHGPAIIEKDLFALLSL